MRLIDIEDALRKMEKAEHLMHSINGIKAVDIGAVRQFFGMLKPVDAVEVVRCKDCIHWYEPEGVCLKIYSDGNVSPYAWQDRKPDDFCSYGKKKI